MDKIYSRELRRINFPFESIKRQFPVSQYLDNTNISLLCIAETTEAETDTRNTESGFLT